MIIPNKSKIYRKIIQSSSHQPPVPTSPAGHARLLPAWLSARSSPVREATPSARATAEPFSSSVRRAAMGGSRWVGNGWNRWGVEPLGPRVEMCGTFGTFKRCLKWMRMMRFGRIAR